MDVIRDDFVGVTAIKGKRALVPCKEPLCASRRVRKADSCRLLILASQLQQHGQNSCLHFWLFLQDTPQAGTGAAARPGQANNTTDA